MKRDGIDEGLVLRSKSIYISYLTFFELVDLREAHLGDI
jgi:hypothetical protein